MWDTNTNMGIEMKDGYIDPNGPLMTLTRALTSSTKIHSTRSEQWKDWLTLPTGV